MEEKRECECSPGCCGQTVSIKPASTNVRISGYINTDAGQVPAVEAELSFKDILGTVMVRCSINRSSYRVKPGLYAVGNPGKASFVFASANYKLSFDTLRKNLAGLDAWILVLDTKGINVWCAAGKGTFGTEELVLKIKQTRLDAVVSHRRIIIPQLGAPGIAAHEVKKKSGFSLVYGPVRAGDIPRFLENGMKADRKMREVTFTFKDRLLLAPVELAGTLKYLFPLYLGLVLLFRITGGSAAIADIAYKSLLAFLPFGIAVFIGTVITPVFLPLIPGKAFAWKGWLAGAVFTALYFPAFNPSAGWFIIVSYALILPAISAFLAMNFTGASAYTSLSGVLYEMKFAVPLIIVSFFSGVILLAITGIATIVVKGV